MEHILSDSLAEFDKLIVVCIFFKCECFHSFQLFIGSPKILVQLFYLFLLQTILFDFVLQHCNLFFSLLDNLFNGWRLDLTIEVFVLDDVEELSALQGYRL